MQLDLSAAYAPAHRLLTAQSSRDAGGIVVDSGVYAYARR